MSSAPDLNADPWLVTLGRERPDAHTHLYCFPHAGAGASAFLGWALPQREDVQLNAVVLPGRESRLRHRALGNLDAVVEHATTSILHANAGNIALLGHSFGALLAYLVAERLDERGRHTSALIVSGARAPHLPRPDAAIHDAPDDVFVDVLTRRYGGIPDAVLADAEMMELFLPPLRADFRMLETFDWRRATPLDVPVLALSGTRDRAASPADVAHWADLALNTFEHHQLDGDHFFIRSARDQLLALVDAALRRVPPHRRDSTCCSTIS